MSYYKCYIQNGKRESYTQTVFATTPDEAMRICSIYGEVISSQECDNPDY